MTYHYAKTVPSAAVSFACFEDDKFVGCIVYGSGTNNNLGTQYGLKAGQIYELVRVALNQTAHVQPTTQYIAISLRLMKKVKPLTKMIVSYADIGMQGHEGIIYKAGNWLYVGDIKHEWLLVNGELVHPRVANKRWGSLKNISGGYSYTKGYIKKKFIYCYDKNMRRELERKALPFHGKESGAVPTSTHQKEKSL